MYRLVSQFKPQGDQIKAIAQLTDNFQRQIRHNVLLGATGTGKTFTIANVIENLKQKVLVISHNKTLAIQLFSELKTFFPHNRVEYFISPFDFYQPEAYLPNKDLYIDKSVKWNLDIKKMRMSALNALLTEEGVIVVATVAAIYGVTNPFEYEHFILKISKGQTLQQRDLITFLVQAGYERNDLVNDGSKFMVKGNILTIGLTQNDNFLQVMFMNNQVFSLVELEATTMNVLSKPETYTIFPGNEYVVNLEKIKVACQTIESELIKRISHFNQTKKLIESYRIKTRTEKDLEDLRENGFCKGIENYSLHFDNRQVGEPPFTIMDYFQHFGADFLTVIDESHITVPQIIGMYLGDRARKTTLVDYGFRLPTALDNRPLMFDEFNKKLKNVVYVSATPADYELDRVNRQPVEQIIRPTGLLDPVVEIRPTKNQVADLIKEIEKIVAKKQRVFILTLTIQMAEDLTKYLQERKIKVAYIHNRLKTFERTKVLINLRKGIFDVVVGINLLREGLDIPEVSLVIILDADKTGFLRGVKSLVQMIGRASRNQEGRVILYADKMTRDMKLAIGETDRRRQKQLTFNQQNNIVPQTIIKPIDDIFLDEDLSKFYEKLQMKKEYKITKTEKLQITKSLNDKMNKAVKKMDFELAAKIRDMIFDLMRNNK